MMIIYIFSCQTLVLLIIEYSPYCWLYSKMNFIHDIIIFFKKFSGLIKIIFKNKNEYIKFMKNIILYLANLIVSKYGQKLHNHSEPLKQVNYLQFLSLDWNR